MSKQYPGGLITKTPVTPAGPYQDGSAPGIWTLEEQAYWKKQGLWPTAGLNPTDPYFQYVTMLLHGDGTNGAQNNTFVDSSTNNFTITRNGNTTQGTFTPYGDNWSNYFSSSSISTASSSAFNCAGDFTLEAWIFPTAAWAGSGSYNPILFVNGTGLYFGQNSAGFGLRQSGTANIISYGTSPTINTWTHVAIVRSGTTITMYYNGTSVATATSSATFSTGTGTIATDGSYSYTGYVSNLRLVKGTAVYTSAFTPSTTPLTAITNTSFLTCQSNRFIDNSTSALALTPSGSPSVQRFSPFSPTTEYSTSVIGGSGYFDGSGDYLNLSTNASLGLGTGTYTAECWVYASAAPAYSVFFEVDVSGLQFGVNASANIAIAQQNVAFTVSSSTPVPLNAWSHIAVSRDGSNVTRIYLNGVQIASATDTTNYATGTTAYINNNTGNSNKITGYIADLRVLKGTALYTSAFTPPTAPLTAITNTSVLLSCTNAGIFDNAMMNDLETVGNAQISTSVKKYGTGSMYFDGTGDYLLAKTNDVFNFGTGDFTVEFWINASASGSYTQVIGTLVSSNENGTWRIGNRFNSLNQIYFARGTGSGFNEFQASVNVNDGAWHHVAVVRNSGTVTIYADGVASASSSITGTCTSANPLYVGYNGRDNAYITGYLDDVRITKGVARYTANFTPPTSAFPNQ